MTENVDGKDKKLVVTFHYQDGDEGSFFADEDRTACFCAKALWEMFADMPGLDKPARITISMVEANDEKLPTS